MSGLLWLDFAIMATSLFNTTLLVWLGLTVLLTAEKRTWGVWLAAAGLLVGAAFFVVHSTILGEGFWSAVPGLDFWWQVGWAPLVLSPFTWYALMLWYTGFWDDRRSAHFRRQFPWLVLATFYTLFLIALLFFANPLPTPSSDSYQGSGAIYYGGGVTLLLGAFPIYVLLCISLALEALLRPGPTRREMGAQARQRARPWLVGATAALLVVSFLVGWLMLRLILQTQRAATLAQLYNQWHYRLSLYDLLLASLIALAIVLLGQAIVTYEVFTGANLPRRGFLRQWRNALILAVCASLAGAASLNSRLPPIAIVLLSLLALAAFYAWVVWQTHQEREASMRQLQPFLHSQKLYEQFTASAGSGNGGEIDPSFQALCRDVLGARQAALTPLGATAALAGEARCYPPGAAIELPPLAGVVAQMTSPRSLGMELSPATQGGMVWVAPLWSDRGLIGLFFLGEKDAGGVYTREEIEIARSAGERLVDLQVSAELARRLMALQRQRLQESLVLDQRTRQTLHDDVLPRLHTALLQLSRQTPPADPETLQSLVETHQQVSNLLRAMPGASPPELSRLGLLGALRKTGEQEVLPFIDAIEWEISPQAEQNVTRLPEIQREVIYLAAREGLRNAARHARPQDGAIPLRLKIQAAWKNGLELRIEDNGAGLHAQPAQPQPVHSGQGLALHSAMMAIIGGTLSLESEPGKFTRLILWAPA